MGGRYSQVLRDWLSPEGTVQLHPSAHTALCCQAVHSYREVAEHADPTALPHPEIKTFMDEIETLCLGEPPGTLVAGSCQALACWPVWEGEAVSP